MSEQGPARGEEFSAVGARQLVDVAVHVALVIVAQNGRNIRVAKFAEIQFRVGGSVRQLVATAAATELSALAAPRARCAPQWRGAAMRAPRSSRRAGFIVH